MAGKWNPSHHPRDARGRFTRSATRVMKPADTKRARTAVSGLKPRPAGTAVQARTYLDSIAAGKPPADGVAEYLAGGWKTTNPTLRAGKTDDSVTAIDAAMAPLPDDVMLQRRVPLKMFAHIPMKDLQGMKVRDAAYASTTLAASDGVDAPGDMVTMHIAAAAGTPALVNAADGEILLARDTEVAISRVEANGRGGWDVYGVVIPKTDQPGKPADDVDQGDDTDAPVGAPAAAAKPKPARKPAAARKPADTDGGQADAPPIDMDMPIDRTGNPEYRVPADVSRRDAALVAQDRADRAKAATPAGTRVPRRDQPEYQADYEQGWTDGDDLDNLDGADDKPAGWHDGFNDRFGDRPKWDAADRADQADDEAETAAAQRPAPTAKTLAGHGNPLVAWYHGGGKTPEGSGRKVNIRRRDLGDDGLPRDTQLIDPATGQLIEYVPPSRPLWLSVEPNAPHAVTDVERDAHVTVTGTPLGSTLDVVDATGYVATQYPSDGRHVVVLSEYPGGAGKRTILDVNPTTPAIPAVPDPTPNVVLWRDRKSGRAVANPSQQNLVRGDVIRDPEREATVRTAITAMHGTAAEPEAPDAPEAPAEPPAGTAAPAAPRPDPRQDPQGYAVSLSDDELTRLAGTRGVLPRVKKAVAAEQQRRAQGEPAPAPTVSPERAAALAAKKDELAKANAALGDYQPILGGPRGGKQAKQRTDAALRRTATMVEGIRRLEHEVAALQRPETPKAPAGGFGPEQLAGARFVRTRYGWHEVVKVNRASVKVKAAPGMDDTISTKKIIEVRGDATPAADALTPEQEGAAIVAAQLPAVPGEPDAVAVAQIRAERADERGDTDAGRLAATADSTSVVAGRTFARTQGVDVADTDARFRMRKARVGSRIVDVHDEQGQPRGTLTEDRAGWTVDPSGARAADFPAAVAALDTAPADTTPGTPAAPDLIPPAGTTAPAGPAAQLDMLGGETTFVPASRSTLGMADRADVGRTRGQQAVQQLGMFDVSDQRQMDGQAALLDALFTMPAPTEPALDVAAPAAVTDTPNAPAGPVPVVVPDDLTGQTDEQLGELFRQLSEVDNPADLDEAAMSRITDEWDRRESEMRDVLDSVPADLSTLDDDQAAELFARVTSHPGTLETDVVARLEADLDRRDAEHVAAQADLQIKRDLLATDVAIMSDQEVEQAAEWAADLGDESAIERVYAEWERREAAERARLAAAEAERIRTEETSRIAAAALIERVAAERAAEYAEQQRRQLDAAMSAARAASIVQTPTEAETRNAAGLLGEDGLRKTFGDAQVDAWLANVGDDPSAYTRDRVLLDAASRNISDDDRARLLYAAADVDTGEFRGMSDEDLAQVIYSGAYPTGDDWEERRDRKMRAGRERSRRYMAQQQQRDAQEYARFHRRAAEAPVADLTDGELAAAPAALALSREAGLLDRLRAVDAEAGRRQQQADDTAARFAAGPSGPARVSSPVVALGDVEMMASRNGSGFGWRGAAAADRLAAAKRYTYGLPADADDKAVKAAARTDPRGLPEQSAMVLAWYRHLGTFALADDRDPGMISAWMRGPDDEPGLPDPLPTLPLANIAKPAEVWEAMMGQAIADRDTGDDAGAIRFTMAKARAYGVPFNPDEHRTRETVPALVARVRGAETKDPRTAGQKAASFIAEWRRLADVDGVDPADTLRAGPTDRGGQKPKGGRGGFATADPLQQRRIDQLVAQGWEFADAHQEVLGLSDEDIRQEQATSAVRAAGGGKGGTAKALEDGYADLVHTQYLAAEQATAGNLLSKAGKAKNINPKVLFSGPSSTANRNASEELLRWWADNPRMTFAQYKQQMTGQGRQARASVVAGAKGNEFA